MKGLLLQSLMLLLVLVTGYYEMTAFPHFYPYAPCNAVASRSCSYGPACCTCMRWIGLGFMTSTRKASASIVGQLSEPFSLH